MLKEQFRLVFAHRGRPAVRLLDNWLAWARRSKIPAFVELYHRIVRHRQGLVASVTHGLSNGLTESVNTKLRLLTRIAYGFRNTDNLIARCLLDRGGHCPPPYPAAPHRSDPRIGTKSPKTTGWGTLLSPLGRAGARR